MRVRVRDRRMVTSPSSIVFACRGGDGAGEQGLVALPAAQPTAEARGVSGGVLLRRSAAAQHHVPTAVGDHHVHHAGCFQHHRDLVGQQGAIPADQGIPGHGDHLARQSLSLVLVDLGQFLDAQVDDVEAQDEGDERWRHQRHQQHAIPNAPALEHGILQGLSQVPCEKCALVGCRFVGASSPLAATRAFTAVPGAPPGCFKSPCDASHCREA